MSRRRFRGGFGPAFVVFALFGGVFFYLVAYYAFGWWGVGALALASGLISVVVRSEAARMARERQRAEDEWVRYRAMYTTGPRRRSRSRRGGAR